jgi:hypothetical protein
LEIQVSDFEIHHLLHAEATVVQAFDDAAITEVLRGVEDVGRFAV